MALIGVNLGQDQLVLTRGRDFKWNFQNLDVSGDPADYPAGDLYFELATGGEHNARQTYTIVGSTGGTYTLGLGANDTAALPFNASQYVVQQEIEALPGVGVGNVAVTAYYTPQWIGVVDWTDSVGLSPAVVELFNQTVTTTFQLMDFITGGAGVYLSGSYSTSSYQFRLTYKTSLLESEIINFVAGVIGTIIGTINTALSGLEAFTGNIADMTLTYTEIRQYNIEFINELAQTPVAAMTLDSSITGIDVSAVIQQLAPGRAKYTYWNFDIVDDVASIKIESEEADAMASRTKWQLVFLPDGEEAGGEAVARGTVRVQD